MIIYLASSEVGTKCYIILVSSEIGAKYYSLCLTAVRATNNQQANYGKGWNQ